MKNAKLVVALLLGLTAMPSWADEVPAFNLLIKGGHFTPETITAPAGKKFQLVVKNEGPGAEEFESSDLNREKVIAPGKTLTISFGPLAAGSYKFVGEYHEDTAKGTIVVK
jgi:plastocyanin